MTEEKPPCRLDPDRRYSVVKDGKLFDSTSCIHEARSMAKFHNAQLWRRGKDGYPSMLVSLD